jgi:hypothetical protein
LRSAATDAAGRILQKTVSVSIPLHASYSTYAQPPLSTHMWYKSRREEKTERRGGGDLSAADGVAVRRW